LVSSGLRGNAMKWRGLAVPSAAQLRGLFWRAGKSAAGASKRALGVLAGGLVVLGSRLAARVWSTSESSLIITPLILKLAARNLFHDPLRFIATIIGIVFSMVLVTVQMGLFLSFARTVTTMIDHTPADLWIMPLATKCFEDPSLLDERDRFRAMSLEGVVDAVPMLVSFAQWRVPSGGTTPVLVVGTDLRKPGLLPWNIVAGDLNALSIPDAVAVDQTYFGRLGINGLGDTVEIRDQKARFGCSPRASGRSRPRPSYLPRSIERGLTPERHRTKPLICSCGRPRERTSRAFRLVSTKPWTRPKL